jgi:hypothetical protein
VQNSRELVLALAVLELHLPLHHCFHLIQNINIIENLDEC